MSAATYTVSHPGDWDGVLVPLTGTSQRSTTSSRHPGRAIEGTVAYQLSRVVECRACGGLRRESPYPHAPRWRDGVQVDCVGQVLQ